jgi:hypothetical protein
MNAEISTCDQFGCRSFLALVVRAAGVGMGRLGHFEHEVPGLDLAPAKLMFRFLNIIPPAKVGELCH